MTILTYAAPAVNFAPPLSALAPCTHDFAGPAGPTADDARWAAWNMNDDATDYDVADFDLTGLMSDAEWDALAGASDALNLMWA